MENHEYDVVFGLEHYTIFAGNPMDAGIVAVAKRIGEGKSIVIDQIYDVEREESIVLFRCHVILVEA